ncbi:MAG: hypothetical protein WC659_05320 [Patescibacteria group bacterium]
MRTSMMFFFPLLVLKEEVLPELHTPVVETSFHYGASPTGYFWFFNCLMTDARWEETLGELLNCYIDAMLHG